MVAATAIRERLGPTRLICAAGMGTAPRVDGLSEGGLHPRQEGFGFILQVSGVRHRWMGANATSSILGKQRT